MNGMVMGFGLATTDIGPIDHDTFGVRAVVTLSNELVLKGNSIDGWSY